MGDDRKAIARAIQDVQDARAALDKALTVLGDLLKPPAADPWKELGHSSSIMNDSCGYCGLTGIAFDCMKPQNRKPCTKEKAQ